MGEPNWTNHWSCVHWCACLRHLLNEFVLNDASCLKNRLKWLQADWNTNRKSPLFPGRRNTEQRHKARVLLCRSNLTHVRAQEDTENDLEYELPFS